jgi:hypothetical protein
MHRNVAWHFQDARFGWLVPRSPCRYLIHYDLEWNPARMEQRAIPLEDLTLRLIRKPLNMRKNLMTPILGRRSGLRQQTELDAQENRK